MLKIYPDSSAVVKRYVSEPGSSAVDQVFERYLLGDLIATSAWIIGGEVGILDIKKGGWLAKDEFRTTRGFVGETMRLLHLVFSKWSGFSYQYLWRPGLQSSEHVWRLPLSKSKHVYTLAAMCF